MTSSLEDFDCNVYLPITTLSSRHIGHNSWVADDECTQPPRPPIQSLLSSSSTSSNSVNSLHNFYHFSTPTKYFLV